VAFASNFASAYGGTPANDLRNLAKTRLSFKNEATHFL
jgi:hypothetical protein